MKKFLLVLIICILVIGGFFAFALYKFHYTNNIAITVNDSRDDYRVYATYPLRKAANMQHFLATKMHKRELHEKRVEGYIQLNDHSEIYISSIPGKLLLKMDKHENDQYSKKRIKKIVEELKLELTREN